MQCVALISMTVREKVGLRKKARVTVSGLKTFQKLNITDNVKALLIENLKRKKSLKILLIAVVTLFLQCVQYWLVGNEI